MYLYLLKGELNKNTGEVKLNMYSVPAKEGVRNYILDDELDLTDGPKTIPYSLLNRVHYYGDQSKSKARVYFKRLSIKPQLGMKLVKKLLAPPEEKYVSWNPYLRVLYRKG